MPPRERAIKDCARSMVETCNLKQGDGVVVKGGAHNQALLEEIAIQCYKKGATPTLVVSSDRFVKRVYNEVPVKTLETVPKQYLGLVKAADMLITVEELDDPSIAHQFPRDKIKARQKASLPLYDIIFHAKDGKKWLYAGWPTKAAARTYGVPYSTMREIVLGGISVKPSYLMKVGKKLAAKFKHASWVHVWDDKGTDFRVKVEGRRLNIDDAFISDADWAIGDRGANLPAGELFIAPHETVGGGRLYCPVTSDSMSEKRVEDVNLEFKDGKLVLESLRARKNEKAMLESFRQSEELDKNKYDPVRTRNVAELGIGFNPRITNAIGYILTDEKVAGTVHLAFGSNNTYGGKSESVMHWDFVSAPGVNIEVERMDGRMIPAMIRGKLQL